MTHLISSKTNVAGTSPSVNAMSVGMAVYMVVGLVCAPQIRAQSQSARLEFELVSITPAAAGGAVGTPEGGLFFPGPRIKWSGNTLTLVNFTAKDLIREAFSVKDEQISGKKGFDSQRYQIAAKAPRGTTEDQARLMSQTLLAVRFKLEFHREKRELPAYALVVANNGPRIAKSKEPSKAKVGDPVMFKIGRGHISQPLTMTELADLLATRLGRPVSDMTSLKGTFDINLEWTPDEGESDPFAGLPPKPGADAYVGQGKDGPSIFAALQEQLGLKLETRKRTQVEVIVVDHLEKPSAN